MFILPRPGPWRKRNGVVGYPQGVFIMSNGTELGTDVDEELHKETYGVMAATALLLGVGAVLGMWYQSWWGVLLTYAPATLLRLIAGVFMNRMGDAKTVNAWNDRYHRKLVIALNAGVGGALLTALWYHRWDYGEFWGNQYGHLGTRWFLTIAVVLYFIAARFTRPNTFGARVRSAALTVVLLGTMAYLAWPSQWGLYVLAGVIVLNIVLLRLRALQRRFGWADR